jgi:hypothetical protein
LRAHERAAELAEALIDGPLDDAELGSITRQRAVIAALDATFPLQTVSVELSVPSDPDELDGMSWNAMRQLAAQLLSPDPAPTPELEPASTQASR